MPVTTIFALLRKPICALATGGLPRQRGVPRQQLLDVRAACRVSCTAYGWPELGAGAAAAGVELVAEHDPPRLRRGCAVAQVTPTIGGCRNQPIGWTLVAAATLVRTCDPPHRRRTDYRVTFLVLCVGVSSFSLLQSMVNPVLPTIEAALDTDQATVTWVLTAYLLSASVFTPIIGRVGDKVGKERMLVFALGALAAGSLLAAVAPTIGVLIAARAIQGIGGGVLPLTFGIIRDEFPRDKVAECRGYVGRAARRRRRGRARDRRTGRQRAELPLALLDPDGDDPDRRDRRLRLRARVARAHARSHQRRQRPPALGLAGRAAARRQPGPQLGLDLRPR